MCNLYSLILGQAAIRAFTQAMRDTTGNLPMLPGIFPDTMAPVVYVTCNGDRELAMMRWGFPPPPNVGGRPITNVRNLDSPFWRNALTAQARRCIVPVTRFCEWTAEPDPATKRKAKVWFGLNEGADPLFAFAGLWRPGDQKSEEPYMAFLTCEANEIVGPIHPKAMPVMLRPDETERWLTAERADACALAQPFAATEMRVLS